MAKTKALAKTEKRILITGGTGFLGVHIVRQFLSAGEKNLKVMASRVPEWMKDAGVKAVVILANFAHNLEKIIDETGSKSDIVYVPYAEAYGDGFEDMERRVPNIDLINQLVGWKPGRDFPTGCCTARPWPSACAWPSRSPRSWGTLPPEQPGRCAGISPP